MMRRNRDKTFAFDSAESVGRRYAARPDPATEPVFDADIAPCAVADRRVREVVDKV